MRWLARRRRAWFPTAAENEADRRAQEDRWVFVSVSDAVQHRYKAMFEENRAKVRRP